MRGGQKPAEMVQGLFAFLSCRPSLDLKCKTASSFFVFVVRLYFDLFFLSKNKFQTLPSRVFIEEPNGWRSPSQVGELEDLGVLFTRAGRMEVIHRSEH